MKKHPLSEGMPLSGNLMLWEYKDTEKDLESMTLRNPVTCYARAKHSKKPAGVEPEKKYIYLLSKFHLPC